MVAASSSAHIVGAAAVTPSDSADIATTKGLLIGGTAGAIKMTFFDGSTVTMSGLLAGTEYPFQVTRVWSTGTTATSIFALY